MNICGSDTSLLLNRCSQKNLNRNAKLEWEIKLEEQVKKLRQVKVLRKKKHRVIWDETTKKKKKKKTADKSECITWRDESKDIGENKETQKIFETEWRNTLKIGHSEITKENSTKSVDNAQRHTNNRIQRKKKNFGIKRTEMPRG